MWPVTIAEILHKKGWNDAYFFVGIKNDFGLYRRRRNLKVTKPFSSIIETSRIAVAHTVNNEIIISLPIIYFIFFQKHPQPDLFPRLYWDKDIQQ